MAFLYGLLVHNLDDPKYDLEGLDIDFENLGHVLNHGLGDL